MFNNQSDFGNFSYSPFGWFYRSFYLFYPMNNRLEHVHVNDKEHDIIAWYNQVFLFCEITGGNSNRN
jgi:hypothetical protein